MRQDRIDQCGSLVSGLGLWAGTKLSTVFKYWSCSDEVSPKPQRARRERLQTLLRFPLSTIQIVTGLLHTYNNLWWYFYRGRSWKKKQKHGNMKNCRMTLTYSVLCFCSSLCLSALGLNVFRLFTDFLDFQSQKSSKVISVFNSFDNFHHYTLKRLTILKVKIEQKCFPLDFMLAKIPKRIFFSFF